MSDPAGRKPKGAMVRQAPDWFADNLAVGGLQTILTGPPPGNTFWSISLANDDQQGRVFRVYGISVSSEGGGGLAFAFVKGTVGVFQNKCSSLRPDGAVPSGQIFLQGPTTIPGQINPFDPGNDVGLIGAGGFDSGTTIAPFPLFILPQGYSLVGFNLGSSLPIGCFFWYQMAAK